MESNNSNVDNSSIEKPKITLNRKMRMWNKYRVYVIGVAGALVVVLIFVLAFKGLGSDKSDGVKDTARETQKETVAEEETTEVVQETKPQATVAPVPETTTVATPSGNIHKLDNHAEVVSFNAGNKLDNAVFVGDFITTGISGYGYVDESRVFSDNGLTSDRMDNYTNDIVKEKPKYVFIMIGVNDLNYGTRNADDIYNFVTEFITDLKSKLPTTEICVLSTLPVSSRVSSTTAIKQEQIDNLNKKYEENAASLKITYIDVASAYKADDGFIDGQVTDNGLNLKNAYYPFMLNGIAGVIK